MVRITIIGGGIAGLTCAIALKQAGFQPEIVEAAPNISAVGAGLVLAANAMKALKHISIEEDVVNKGRLLPAFSIYDSGGKVIMRTDSISLSQKYGVDNFAIHRADLHSLLLSKTNDLIVNTNRQAVDFIQKPDSVIIHFKDGTQLETDFLIVADGIHSAIRQKLIPNSLPRYAGYTCWRAVIESSNLKITETSETWGTEGRFGIVPLKENKIYWFACINAPEKDEKMKKFTISDLRIHFKHFHPTIPDVLWETPNEALIHNDILDIKPLSQFAHGRIVLIGDAAHATTPNLGQGACQAIEDAVILGEMMKKNADIRTAFLQFEQKRLGRTRYIVNTSRRLGELAQTSNSFAASLRNFFFRLIPESVSRQQFKKLYDITF